MPDFICIGVPQFLGEMIEGRDEVAAIRVSGIAAEIGAPWVDVQPDVAPGADPLVTVNRALAKTIRAYPDRVPSRVRGGLHHRPGRHEGPGSPAPAHLLVRCPR